ncbi:hypothetical protein JJQ72_10190 [Paenibacillus sp. F411]|uniref:YxiJ family protein n=1 Tax=Paenibacillus sp. F411 TaxID=2820239 RepID=UPI001AAF81E4|nr:YxiJ family protein [Paenibacillus sp. F411]MBO2944336.1 hypothetical protein [Paenibacillus sp. F411]
MFDRYHDELCTAFPYEDIYKMKKDFEYDFASLEDECFNADFSEYCALMVGTISYILIDDAVSIPAKQIKLLDKDFFQMFPQYSFIQSSIINYPEFHNKYVLHEKVRKLLVDDLRRLSERH